MQNQIRTHVAALMLLVPAATALVALPAAAQQRATVAASLRIDSFELRGGDRFQAGRELRFRVEGTPNARASVDIPNVVRNLQLRETQRGVYEGDYTVRQRESREDFSRATATLQDRNQRTTARVVLRDEAPQITQLVPADGARVDDSGRVRIAARLDDRGDRGPNRGASRNDVTLRVDGRDVTRDARIDRDEIEYSANLPRGRHTAELVVRDRAGNTARRSWSFEVVARQGVRPTPPGVGVPLPLPLPVPRPPVGSLPQVPMTLTSHSADADYDLFRPPVLRGRTLPGASVRVLVEAVIDNRGGNTRTLVSDQLVRADGSGQFAVQPTPPVTRIGTASADRVDIILQTTVGGRTMEERVSLRRRG